MIHIIIFCFLKIYKIHLLYISLKQNIMQIRSVQAIIVVSLMFFVSCSTGSSDKRSGMVILENTEWTNQWVENTQDSSLPVILLLGDSHVQQYYGFVKNELKGKFNFGRYTTSKCLGNPFLAKEIKTFLEQYPCDVIVFNNGLHGPEYPDSVYAGALPEIFGIFKEVRPQAKVLWVNTTPRRNRDDLSQFLYPSFDHVKARNRYAKEYMDKHGIPVVDMWSLGYEHPEYYSADGVHFNGEGKKAEARLVANAVMYKI
jgi:hypothetical protein